MISYRNLSEGLKSFGVVWTGCNRGRVFVEPNRYLLLMFERFPLAIISLSLLQVDVGCIMARYYVAFESMKMFLSLTGKDSLEKLVHILH